ncbi:MAG: hypothetical protein KJ069_06790 [Anaerolineae bacterium]|nr:hypothetical protein [Anaerolineae bacterium]
MFRSILHECEEIENHLHPIILYELAKARYNELLQAAEQYRRCQQLMGNWPLPLPRLTHFFPGGRHEGETAVSIQTR